MISKPSQLSDGDAIALRKLAEARWHDRAAHLSANIESMSHQDTQQLVYELQVHQIELEMQNDELRRTRDELDTAHARYFDFFDMAPVGYGLVSDQGVIKHANLTAASILGSDRQALAGHSFADFVTPQDQDVLYFFRRNLLDTRKPESCDLQLLRSDATTLWVNLAGIAVREDDGSTVLRLVMSDITERKKAEEATRIAATAFETQQGMTITDTNGKILRVNSAFTKITGYSAEEVVGKNPRILQSGRQDAAFYKAMWDRINENGFWQGEIWNKRKTGEIYPEWHSISAVKDDFDVVTHYVGAFSDISERKSDALRIETLAFYDPLTDLPNRRLLLDRLQHSLAAGRRHPRRSALLFIDLDHFKSVNDSQGHAEGDRLLQQVSERLRTCIRGCDTAARLGGDEFVVLLEDLADDEIEATTQTRITGEKILTELRHAYSLASGPHHVTASIGVAFFGGSLESYAYDPLIRADQAMYQAKMAGRDTLCFFDPKIQAAADAQTALEMALRQALATKQFLLRYQPQVSLRTGEIIGLEALIRWQRPDGTLVPPNEFIPAAERTRLILPLGQWVIEEACAQIRAWREAGLPQVKVAVNVSAHQFLAGDLDVIVSQALQRHGVSPHLLEVELTESVLMHDPVAARVMLERIRATGVTLSLDDFGTGYSSLAYLSRFPFNLLKIDCSFVQDMVTDPGAATIVKMIIDLAHRMRLEVIAEGVETQAQLGLLQKHGCDQMQGYLFSRPMPAQEISAMLQEGRTLPVGQQDARQQKTLLLVDDDASILSSLRRLLRTEGYHILTAESGEQALELLASHQVQVLLSDQRMSGMNGTELLRRACVTAPDTVRMILSGYTDLQTVTQSVNEGFIYKYVTKPWNDDDLKAHIRDAFQHAGEIKKSTEVDAS